MDAVDPERLLTMSAFEAAFVIRGFRKQYPTLSDNELIATICNVRADYSPLDYETGLHLELLISDSVQAFDSQCHIFFTAAIDVTIARGLPLWARLAPSGRDQVVKAMSVNGVQCLRGAGLLETPPSLRVVQWWDTLAAKIRVERDEELLALGRAGELLSLEQERRRLRAAGSKLEPIWASVEDNRLGYDILSYRITEKGYENRLIEVKATNARPPRFILTSGEWLAAERFGDALEFHLWSLPDKKLYVLTPDDVRKHIPTNQGYGEWLQVEVTP